MESSSPTPRLLPLLLLQIGVTLLVIVMAVQALMLMVTFVGLFAGVHLLVFGGVLASFLVTWAIVAWLLRLERRMSGWAVLDEVDWVEPFE
ncbi:MAG: hypothetical protein QNJ98_06315 [Planctomycetota bacterium]|nr:hypothetical protein [Planctomycetota bacterium]